MACTMHPLPPSSLKGAKSFGKVFAGGGRNFYFGGGILLGGEGGDFVGGENGGHVILR